MGVCSCVMSDNIPNKTVDITGLQNNKLDIADKDSTSILKHVTEKQKPIAISKITDTNNIANNNNDRINDDEEKIKQKIHHKNTESSNRSNTQHPIIKKNLNHFSISLENKENLQVGNSNSNNNINNNSNINININNINSSIPISNKDSVLGQVKPETTDSRIMCSHQTISRFLNRTFINIVILGGKRVGKSAFVIKFVENIFEKLYIPTLGSEERRKKFSYNTHLYDLNFTVTSGNDYKADYSKAYEAVDFFLVFYDVTSMESFEQANKILKSEVKLFLYSYGQLMTNVFMVGNKIDYSQHQVSEDLAKAYCEKNNFQWFGISVKTNKNITTMMKTMIKTVDDIAYPN